MTATDDATAPRTVTDAGTLATLVAEHDFLLRSIVDLDTEHAAGELADDRYQELLNDYTVQAATVMRALDRLGAADEPSGTRDRRRRAPAIVAVAVVVTVVGGGLLVRSLGDRGPGQTITGNAQSAAPDLAAPDLAALERAVRERPDDATAQLDYAHALLEDGQMVDALKAFDAAATLDPGNPEPRAYGAWIVFLAGLSDEALSRLDAAVAIDPGYPDARFFRGMVLLRGRGDEARAQVELREFVRLAPPGPERDRVRALITEIEGRSSTSTTVASP